MQILLNNSKEILSAQAWAQWNDWKCPFRVIHTTIHHLKSKYANTKANTSLEKQIHKHKGKSTCDGDDDDVDDDDEEEEDVHLGGSARGAEDLELVANLQRQPLLLLQEYNHHHY